MEIADIPTEELYGHPAMQQMLSKLDTLSELAGKLEDVKIPYIRKNQVLMSPGVWNNFFYSADSLKDAFVRTDWSKKENRALFLDHMDRSSREWIGEVINIRMENDSILGDLIVVDKPTAIKLEYGAKMGISPKVTGHEDSNTMVDFMFDNFSVVINPAVKTAYINNSEVNKMTDPIIGQNAAPPVEPYKKPEEVPIAPTMSDLDKELSAWTDKIKDWMGKNPGKPIADAIAAIKGEEAVNACKPEEKMASDVLMDQISKLIEILKQQAEVKPKDANYPYPYPNPEKKMEEQKVEKTMSQELTVRDSQIKELSERLERAERLLNEPVKITQKIVETETSTTQEQAVDPDLGFLQMLQNI
jgi:hypothetical protein